MLHGTHADSALFRKYLQLFHIERILVVFAVSITVSHTTSGDAAITCVLRDARYR